jgi:hypothetical protein
MILTAEKEWGIGRIILKRKSNGALVE